MAKRVVEIGPIYSKGMREPRQGELNYELKKILVKHCLKQPLKDSSSSVQIAAARVARKFGIHEFAVVYDRDTNTRHGKPWVCECVDIRMIRHRANGTMAIHRVGASSYPHFFKKEGVGYANLSAPRDVCIYYGIDDPADWERSLNPDKIPARLKAKWKRDGRKKYANA